MSVRASIDIGSNSVLLLAAELNEGNDFKIIANESRVTGLGRNLDQTGIFCQEAMSETYQALSDYKKICLENSIKAENIIITATEASRVAKNASEFFSKIKKELSLTISIITGEGEAYYSTAGVLFDKTITDSEIVIMDIGGASTELIKVDVQHKKIRETFSMPVGVVRMTNWRESGTKSSQLEEILQNYSEKLSKVESKKLFCVAGTMTSVANMLLDYKTFVESDVHGFEFTKKDLVLLKEKTRHFNPSDYLERYPFLGKRSNTIKAGLELALTVLNRLDVETVCVSTYGLRYGTLLEGKIGEEYAWSN